MTKLSIELNEYEVREEAFYRDFAMAEAAARQEEPLERAMTGEESVMSLQKYPHIDKWESSKKLAEKRAKNKVLKKDKQFYSRFEARQEIIRTKLSQSFPNRFSIDQGPAFDGEAHDLSFRCTSSQTINDDISKLWSNKNVRTKWDWW